MILLLCLSDEAFGSLPARMYDPGSFTFEDIKVGDILRVSGDAHTVIVLEVNDAGVLVAEGNWEEMHKHSAKTSEKIRFFNFITS